MRIIDVFCRTVSRNLSLVTLCLCFKIVLIKHRFIWTVAVYLPQLRLITHPVREITSVRSERRLTASTWILTKVEFRFKIEMSKDSSANSVVDDWNKFDRRVVSPD